MKRRIVKMLVIIVVLLVSTLTLYTNIVCTNTNHRNTYPVNPYCKKCRLIDGIIQHECKNPDGKDLYCNSCGKIILSK